MDCNRIYLSDQPLEEGSGEHSRWSSKDILSLCDRGPPKGDVVIWMPSSTQQTRLARSTLTAIVERGDISQAVGLTYTKPARSIRKLRAPDLKRMAPRLLGNLFEYWMSLVLPTVGFGRSLVVFVPEVMDNEDGNHPLCCGFPGLVVRKDREWADHVEESPLVPVNAQRSVLVFEEYHSPHQTEDADGNLVEVDPTPLPTDSCGYDVKVVPAVQDALKQTRVMQVKLGAGQIVFAPSLYAERLSYYLTKSDAGVKVGDVVVATDFTSVTHDGGRTLIKEKLERLCLEFYSKDRDNSKRLSMREIAQKLNYPKSGGDSERYQAPSQCMPASHGLVLEQSPDRQVIYHKVRANVHFQQ